MVFDKPILAANLQPAEQMGIVTLAGQPQANFEDDQQQERQQQRYRAKHPNLMPDERLCPGRTDGLAGIRFFVLWTQWKNLNRPDQDLHNSDRTPMARTGPHVCAVGKAGGASATLSR